MSTNIGQLKDQIKSIAQKAAPNECCGLIVSKDNDVKVVEITNVHSDPKSHFRMHVGELWKALLSSSVIAYFHSHTDADEKPSKRDLATQRETDAYWLIYSTLTDSFHTISPNSGDTPLLGREYSFGRQDCFTLVKDYYHQRLGIEVKDYFRFDPNFFRKGNDFIGECIEISDFEKVNSLQLHDLIVMQIRSDVPNHVGVYSDQDLIMHHAIGRLSCEQPFGGIWLKNTKLILRHKSLC